MRRCALVSNHGLVLAYVAENPKPSTQEIAQEIGLSVRGVGKIINDLRDNGYLSWQREGRRNRYTVHSARSTPQNLKADLVVAYALKTIACILENTLESSSEDGSR